MSGEVGGLGKKGLDKTEQIKDSQGGSLIQRTKGKLFQNNPETVKKEGVNVGGVNLKSLISSFEGINTETVSVPNFKKSEKVFKKMTNIEPRTEIEPEQQIINQENNVNIDAPVKKLQGVPKQVVQSEPVINNEAPKIEEVQSEEDLRQISLHSKDPKVLDKLSESNHEMVRSNVAFNPDTPPDVLLKLANDSSEDVRKSLLYNPNVTSEVEAFLQKIPVKESDVKFALIEKLLLKDFYLLANDPSEIVRNNVAMSPFTPGEIIEKFASSDNEQLRMAVSINQGISPEILKLLATDKNETIRLNVMVNNPSTPPELASGFGNDESVYLRTILANSESRFPGIPLQRSRRAASPA